MSGKAEKGIPIDFHRLTLGIVALGALRALGSWTEVSPNAVKLARRCIHIAATRRVRLNAPAGSREFARVFAGQASTARRDTLAGQRTFLHDLAPIWEDLIDRFRHVDERFVREGCDMPDSLKPVKSYDWTDEEWLRLMREIDPKEEISAIERRVAEWREAADHDAV